AESLTGRKLGENVDRRRIAAHKPRLVVVELLDVGTQVGGLHVIHAEKQRARAPVQTPQWIGWTFGDVMTERRDARPGAIPRPPPETDRVRHLAGFLLGGEEKPQRFARRSARVILDEAVLVTVAMKELIRILPQLLFLQHGKTGEIGQLMKIIRRRAERLEQRL